MLSAALPPGAAAATMQGQLEGETEAYRDGRFSFRFAQQVIARPEMEPVCPEVCSIWWHLGRPSLGTVAVSPRVRGSEDRGGVS